MISTRIAKLLPLATISKGKVGAVRLFFSFQEPLTRGRSSLIGDCSFPGWPSTKFQQWGHTLYPMHNDMTEFREKYPKGLPLFLLLSAYELPILVEFFLRTHASSQHATQKPRSG